MFMYRLKGGRFFRSNPYKQKTEDKKCETGIIKFPLKINNLHDDGVQNQDFIVILHTKRKKL